MRFRLHTVCAYALPLGALEIQFTSVNLSSLKFKQNLGLPEEICGFPKLYARFWPRCYRDCEKVLTDSHDDMFPVSGFPRSGKSRGIPDEYNVKRVTGTDPSKFVDP